MACSNSSWAGELPIGNLEPHTGIAYNGTDGLMESGEAKHRPGLRRVGLGGPYGWY